MRTIVLLMLIATGCTAEPDDVQIARVWSAVGGTGAPPTIVWMEGDALDCSGWFRGFREGSAVGRTGSGLCVRGLFDSYADTIYLARADGEPLHKTSLVHELYHAALFRLGNRQQGASDIEHVSDEWKPGGIVESANAMIR